jgi:Membrane domain of glycerophosphoryl diester phosphodiesterase
MSDGSGSPPDPHGRPYPWQSPGQQPGQQPGPYGYPGQAPPPGQPPPGGPGYSPGYGPGAGYGYGHPPQPPRPGIIPLRPLRLGEILDGTVKMVRANPKATLGLSAVVGALTGLPVAVTEAVTMRETGGGDPLLVDPATSEELSTSTLAAQSASSVLSVLLTFVATTILTGLLTRVLGRAVFGARITVGEAWRMTRSRVWALLGLSLLVGLVISLPLAVVVLLAVGVGVASDVTGIAVGVVGGLAWVAYAVILGTRLTLAPAALVLERLGVTDAMRRSWRLVRGDTWRVLGIIVVTQLLIAVVGAVATVPFTMGAGVLAAVGPGSVAVAAGVAVLLAVGQTLASMLTYPFTAGVYGLLYTDRRMRAEAFDLELQTAAARPGDVSIDDLWQPAAASGPPQW